MIFKDLERKLQNDIGKGIFNENNIEGFVSALNEYLWCVLDFVDVYII